MDFHPPEKPTIHCTACHHGFQTWEAWLAHRAEIRDMRTYDGHTRRCLNFEEWLVQAMAEMQQRVPQLI